MNVNGPKVDNHLRITDEPSNLYLTQITNAQASSSASTALAVDQRPRGVTMTILWLPPTESTSSPRCPLEPTKWVSDELHQMTCLLMQLTKPNECKTLCRLSKHLLVFSFQTIDELDSGSSMIFYYLNPSGPRCLLKPPPIVQCQCPRKNLPSNASNQT